MPGNPAPLIIPAIAVLALLLIKKNRAGGAWLILLPLVIAFSLQALVMSGSGRDSDPLVLFSEAALTGVYALTAFWLISFLLEKKHLALVFFGGSGLLLFFAGLRLVTVVAIDADWQVVGVSGILLAIGLPLTMLALAIGGWLSRRQYRPARLITVAIVVLLIGWFLVASPVFLMTAFSRGDLSDMGEFVVAVLCAVGLNAVVLLPFLLLSHLNPFYRARMKALLHLEREEPPVAFTMPLPQPTLPAAATQH